MCYKYHDVLTLTRRYFRYPIFSPTTLSQLVRFPSVFIPIIKTAGSREPDYESMNTTLLKIMYKKAKKF